MDTLFECNYVRTAELNREYYRYWFFGRPIMIIIYTLLLLGFLSGVLELVLHFNLGAPLFLAPFVFCMMYFSYLSAVYTAQRRDQEFTGGRPLEVFIAVTQEKLHYKTSSGTTIELPLSSIQEVKVLKNQIIVLSEAKVIYGFPKDNFVKGTATDMENFLKQKGLLH